MSAQNIHCHEWPLRVYYEDTDAGGVVYYANYLKFCERARTEWLREQSVDQRVLAEQTGLAFLVRSVQADYRAPARLDDLLKVVSTVQRVSGASIVFCQQVMRGDVLLCDVRVTVASVELARGRPAPLPAGLRERFQLCLPPSA